MLKNNLRQLSWTNLMLKEEFNFYIECNLIKDKSIFVYKSQRQKWYDYIYTYNRKYSRKKKIYYCTICQKSQKRNYCMWYKSILTEERTNNNESLKDTQSQSIYKDFVVKDIPINEQNDYIRSSKDTSSTYTTDEDFVVKDILINKQNGSLKDTTSSYTNKDFVIKDTDLYYCKKCTNFQKRNYCFQCENPLMRDKDFEIEQLII